MATKQKPKKAPAVTSGAFIRIGVTVYPDVHARLQKVLKKKNTSVAQWFRQKSDEEIANAEV